jgi:hypothetical protein
MACSSLPQTTNNKNINGMIDFEFPKWNISIGGCGSEGE